MVFSPFARLGVRRAAQSFQAPRARLPSDNDDDDDDILYTPLLLPSSNDHTAGLYMYYNASTRPSKNIRATRFAMACGLFAKRFYGTVVLVRAHATYSSGGVATSYEHDNKNGCWSTLTIQDVYGACCVSPDLRSVVQSELWHSTSV